MPRINRRAMLFGAAGLAISAGESAARSGVVAAVVRDPSAGPNGALTSGLDLEPGQTVATQPGELVNLLFVDGTSLTLGPNSAVRIDRCSFDPTSGKGDLALTLRSGQYHLIGGAIGRTGEILLSTAAGSFTARDAIATFTITEHLAIALQTDGTVRRIDQPSVANRASLSAEPEACPTAVEYAVVLALAIVFVITISTSILSPAQIAKLKKTITNKLPADSEAEPEVDRALNDLNGVLRPLVTLAAARGPAPGMSEAIDREVAIPRLAPHLKARLANNAEAPGRQPRPAVIQRISARLTNRPYQATFPPRQ